ncbi:class I SAM-dependent methyltransferase [Reticulibacter mediterranei]|uniref:Class I SAM-dependent methyltransferase n=1 Tax=Reticulibacter mediterranei TaxID=2778369 RepID=A0A8J3IMU9_9CHLR|nr:class I SAM-dependent methyltransferase [Reticulibacter mediterranei]GHO96963.1 class I SAM-dependent methyltransferase [Reticulibacter mediterranei]
MSTLPSWYYDDRQQIGVDFENTTQVATYDRDQGSNTAEEQALLHRLAIGAGSHVIDLGAGTGSFAIAAAKAGAYVYVVDVSRSMLTYTIQKATAAHLAPIEFHHGGFLTYEHRAAPVDAIITRFALHHLPDFWKMVAFQRMAAMLKPGGIFYLRDTIFSFEPAAYREHINAWIMRVAKEPGTGFVAADFETHVRDEYSTYGWILEGMLTRTGFTIEEATYPSTEYAEYVCRKNM